ncbi:MAG: hypothetical protein IPN36_18730 [Bacteroidetes bacterium]|nr:hypothetical protein [Bacteroidota bacterium]
MKKLIAKFAVAAGMVVAAGTTGSAQNNLGADCGCPQVSSRPTKNFSSYVDVNGNLLANLYLYCDTTYILNDKVWVGAGKTITIAPGTVIKGTPTGIGVQQNSLVIMRGGKINAAGTTTCPIVFTSTNDPVNGTYPIGNRAEWGGIQVLGNAQLARLGGVAIAGGGTTANGEWLMEGLNADARSIFGGGSTPNNNDDSGVLRYVSIRHAGGATAANVELNGLSLGAVGSGTIIENIEVLSNDDDAVEWWGGTVNCKYLNFMFLNDDGYDIDMDYDGKLQFLFGVKAPAAVAPGGESGFEWDGDEGSSTWFGGYSSAVSTIKSHPVVYNATIIGNGSNTGAGGTGTTPGNPFGISFKSDAEGEIYNSIFTGFRGGMNLQSTSDSSYTNWVNNLVKVQCNHWVGCTFPASNQNVPFVAGGADSTKFFGDNNVNTNSIAGFDYLFNINGSTNVVSDNIDVVPNSNLSTTCSAPNDGFFTPANYRGAFEAGKKPWLNKWAYTSVINVIPGLSPCPTDLNSDGQTNTSDFLLFVAQFNLSCN